MARQIYARHVRKGAKMKTFGWPWPQRERTSVEYEHVYNTVYEQCRAHRMTKLAAEAEAATVVKLLPISTNQPLGAARWLENRNGRLQKLRA